MTPTTASNVKKLVAESKYHDETLCQLLDAAQLNLIGKEAKRALNRAARTRITELKELRAHGEGGTHDWPPSKKSRGRKSKDKHGRRSESRTSEVQEPPELDNPGPPAWANEVSHLAIQVRSDPQTDDSRSCLASKPSMRVSQSSRSRSTTTRSLSNLVPMDHPVTKSPATSWTI
jgi:hypothetical protein